MPSSPAERDELVISRIRLAAKIANRHIHRASSRRAYADDIHATALEGLVRAAGAYKPAFGVPFPSYARRRIEGAVLDLFREQDHLSRHYRDLAKASGVEDWSPPMSIEEIQNWEERFEAETARPDDVVAERRAVVAVELAARALPPRMRDVLRLYYTEGLTQKQIGLHFGLTEPRICQILHEAHAKLRAVLGEPPPGRRTYSRRSAA